MRAAAAHRPSALAQGGPITGTLFAFPRGAASTAQAVTVPVIGVSFDAGVEACGGQPISSIVLPAGDVLTIPGPAP
ncbi:hypothetical protein [Burkholderia ubonensis]|uniref:hypothetical protein n=1 Tax=Burkholderia ubonensis TaxID=101571 RepID=UPI001583CFA4|nr:hypothetical protein [Burkholderia ubonensis]